MLDQKIADGLIKIIFLGEVETAVRSGVKSSFGPGQVAQLVGVLSHTPKGCVFDSQSGHYLGFKFAARSGTYGKQLVDVSLSLLSL